MSTGFQKLTYLFSSLSLLPEPGPFLHLFLLLLGLSSSNHVLRSHQTQTIFDRGRASSTSRPRVPSPQNPGSPKPRSRQPSRNGASTNLSSPRTSLAHSRTHDDQRRNLSDHRVPSPPKASFVEARKLSVFGRGGEGIGYPYARCREFSREYELGNLGRRWSKLRGRSSSPRHCLELSQSHLSQPFVSRLAMLDGTHWNSCSFVPCLPER